MGVITRVVAYKTLIVPRPEIDIDAVFEEGEIFEAETFGEDLIVVYYNDSIERNGHPINEKFFNYFTPVSWAKNEEEFLEVAFPNRRSISSKIEELNILLKWREKQKTL